MFEHAFLDMLPLYALDSLSGPEKQELERHLQSGCQLCEEELKSFRDAAFFLPHALPVAPLPAALKERIRQRVEQEVEGARRVIEWPSVVGVAAAIAAIALVLGLFWQNRQIGERDREIASIQKQLADQRKEIAWLRDPSVQLALLTGLQTAPDARAKIVWNPSVARGIFYVNSLPPLAPGKSYQLWVIGKSGPVSAGVFEPASNGTAVVTISDVSYKGGALQFAVTIEPHGGVPQPTGAMVLAGKPL